MIAVLNPKLRILQTTLSCRKKLQKQRADFEKQFPIDLKVPESQTGAAHQVMM